MEIVNAVQHNGLVVAAVAYSAGLASANVPLLVSKFIGLPVVSKWIRANPAVAEAIVNELKKDVDAAVVVPDPTAKPAP